MVRPLDEAILFVEQTNFSLSLDVPQSMTLMSHERHYVSGHRPFVCLFKGVFVLISKSHQRSTLLSLCEWNLPVTLQRASNVQSVSMPWRHQGSSWSSTISINSNDVVWWIKRCFEIIDIFADIHNVGSPLAGLQGRRFKNTYELLNLRALKFSPANKIYIFQCMGKIFFVEFQRYPLKFHKMPYPYIERYHFYTTLKFEELLDIRPHKRFWNATRAPSTSWWLPITYSGTEQTPGHQQPPCWLDYCVT